MLYDWVVFLEHVDSQLRFLLREEESVVVVVVFCVVVIQVGVGVREVCVVGFVEVVRYEMRVVWVRGWYDYDQHLVEDLVDLW